MDAGSTRIPPPVVTGETGSVSMVPSAADSRTTMLDDMILLLSRQTD